MLNVQTVGKRMLRHFVRNATQDNTNRATEVRFVFRAPLVRMPLLMDNLNAKNVVSANIQTRVDKFNARLVHKDKRHSKWAKLSAPNAKPVHL